MGGEGPPLDRRTFVGRAAGLVLGGAAVLEAGCGGGRHGGVPRHWIRLGPVADLPTTTYAARGITVRGGEESRDASRPTSGWNVLPRQADPTVWWRSPRSAPHQGCPTDFVEASRRFVCPCHGGVFDFDGNRMAGPPRRALDRGNTAVRDGIAYLVPIRS